MKTTLKIFLFLVVALGFSATAMAQTANATATSTIMATISIEKDVDMSFGNIIPGVGAGTVILTPAGGRSVTGDVTLPPSGSSGNVAAASFTVEGTAGASFAITLPSTPLTLTGPNAKTMTASTFTSTPSGGGTLTGGSVTVTVGATLNVGAGQESGTYTSVGFPVTVAYN